MTRKLLICPYFGDLPEWWDRYRDEEIPRLQAQGYDVLLDLDLDGFKARVERRFALFGVTADCPIEEGSSKIWDYRCALGLLYADEIEEGGYQWWGHTDFDVVYGRVSEFVTDEKLDRCDIYSDCAHDYLSGPFTIYRWALPVAGLFMQTPDWQHHLTTPNTTAWVEGAFSDIAKSRARVLIENHHAYTEPELLHRDGDRLMWGDREIAYYHFRRTKEHPFGNVAA